MNHSTSILPNDHRKVHACTQGCVPDFSKKVTEAAQKARSRRDTIGPRTESDPFRHISLARLDLGWAPE